jgi:hypothetical protein
MTVSKVTITAADILNGLWSLLNGPSKNGGLTTGQRKALKLILECRGGQEFLTTRTENELEELPHRLWEWAHMTLPKKTRAKLKAQAWATWVGFLIMRGPCYARRTEDERLSYWREGNWPKADSKAV